MTSLADRWRSLMQRTFGGVDGPPPWSAKVETGSDAGYFGPGSAAWEVHGGMPTIVAGIRALLMQTLHPGAMAGVHDHSRYTADPLGRLQGTVQWVVVVTFGDRAAAEKESGRVGRFHDRVHGEFTDASGGQRPYSAHDPDLLRWVHLVFADAFLRSHEIWGSPIPGGADGYVREWARAGELVGVTDAPRSEAELRAQLAGFAPHLRSDARVAEAVRFIRRPPLEPAAATAYRVLFAGAVASLPKDVRRMLGLRRPLFPAITATRLLLRLVEALAGRRSGAEAAALRRIAALEDQSAAR
jgi:uncharacterized protein (DUF2236 family)